MLILFISYASFGRRLVAEGKSFTAMGNFRIETSDQPVVVNGVELDTYIITYDKSELELTIAISREKDCSRYITSSDKLTVQYVCHGTYFGVEKLTSENSVNGMLTSDAELNRTAYFHQKVITSGKNDPVTCMKLIGAYFPELLKSGAEV